jgi:hypothetical protein
MITSSKISTKEFACCIPSIDQRTISLSSLPLSGAIVFMGKMGLARGHGYKAFAPLGDDPMLASRSPFMGINGVVPPLAA